jgi:hypothetical protein
MVTVMLGTLIPWVVSTEQRGHESVLKERRQTMERREALMEKAKVGLYSQKGDNEPGQSETPEETKD